MAWQIPDIPEIHISERWQIKNPFYWFLILLILVLVIGLTVILLWPDNQAMHNNPKFWAFCVGLPTLIFFVAIWHTNHDTSQSTRKTQSMGLSKTTD